MGKKFSRRNIDLDSFDIGEDFLDWSYYNRQDRKRHWSLKKSLEILILVKKWRKTQKSFENILWTLLTVKN